MSDFAAISPSGALLAQLASPGGGLAALAMIIGGDIVHNAIAQSSGTRLTPACFSFGSVAYAFSALSAAFGSSGRLLPAPETPPVKVLGLTNRAMRINKSWTVGRIFQDLELRASQKFPMISSSHGIRITLYDAGGKEDSLQTQYTSRYLPMGAIHWMGFSVSFVQLAIALVPWYRDFESQRNWVIFLTTASGIVIGSLFASVPQWAMEKLPGERHSRDVLALTRGKGFKDVVIIRGVGKGCLDLDELGAGDLSLTWAAWQKRRTPPSRSWTWPLRGSAARKDSDLEGEKSSRGLHREQAVKRRLVFGQPLQLWTTRGAAFVHAVLWLLVLVVIAGLRSHHWYVIGIGALGMLANLAIGTFEVSDEARFLSLEFKDIIMQGWPMDGIMDLESSYGWGRPLLQEFFDTSSLTPDEESWWSGGETGKAAYNRQRQRDLGRRGIPRSQQTASAVLKQPNLPHTSISAAIRSLSPVQLPPPSTAGSKLRTVPEQAEDGSDSGGDGEVCASPARRLTDMSESMGEDERIGPSWSD